MEPYHRQPPARNAKSKLKKRKEKQTTPPTISIVPYPSQQSPRKEKPVQPRHPLQANTQINRTGPTRHIAVPHTDRKYDPARQKSSHESSPKINRTRDESNKWTNTHETPPKSTTEYKEISPKKISKEKSP